MHFGRGIGAARECIDPSPPKAAAQDDKWLPVPRGRFATADVSLLLEIEICDFQGQGFRTDVRTVGQNDYRERVVGKALDGR